MNDQPQTSDNNFDNTNQRPADDDSTSYSQGPQQPVSRGGINDQLLEIKQRALAQLAPVVNNLDQKPEDRFKTIMMMIQASDNQDLIKDAYSAAEEITDERARARALLDIVNEINYFLQHSS